MLGVPFSPCRQADEYHHGAMGNAIVEPRSAYSAITILRRCTRHGIRYGPAPGEGGCPHHLYAVGRYGGDLQSWRRGHVMVRTRVVVCVREATSKHVATVTHKTRGVHYQAVVVLTPERGRSQVVSQP